MKMKRQPVRAGMFFNGKAFFRTPASRRQGTGKGKDDKAMGRKFENGKATC